MATQIIAEALPGAATLEVFGEVNGQPPMTPGQTKR
jgi:hypothetical protein